MEQHYWDVKRDLHKCKDLLCLQIGTLTTVFIKISALPKLFYRFNTIPMKIPTSCMCLYRKPFNSDIYMETQIIKNNQKNLEKKKQRERTGSTQHRTDCKATVIKTGWRRHQERQISHWTTERRTSPACEHASGQRRQWLSSRMRTLFSTNGTGMHDWLVNERTPASSEIDPRRTVGVRIVDDDIGECLRDTGAKGFWDRT